MSKGKEVWRIESLLKWTRQYFADKGLENPRLDAEVLLAHVLQMERLYLYVNFDKPLEDKELAAYRDAVKKRAARWPVAYITGSREFMGLDFKVSPAVLIPRPDTEILVEEVLKRLKEKAMPRFLDIGTGSGAICVSLLANLPEAEGVAVDISPEALAVAGENAAKHQVDSRLTLCLGDLYAPVQKEQFTAIVSNPPYIPNKDIAGLTPEVRQEPHGALAGGTDGLDFYRRLLADGKGYLRPDGFIAFEVGIGQAQAVAALAAEAGYQGTEIIKDYGGIDRVVIAGAGS